MEKTLRMRLWLLVALVCGASVAVSLRLYQIQVLRSADLKSRAASQHVSQVEIGGRRGLIVDRNGRELAVSVETSSLYAHPHRFADDDERRAAAAALAPLLRQSRSSLLRRLRSDRPFVWLKRRLDPETADRVRGLPWMHAGDALGLEREPKRFYPRGKLAVHVIGFSNIDQVGVEGVEERFDHLLRGESATYMAVRDGRGRRVLHRIRPASVQPGELVLTLDVTLQHVVERELDRAMQQTGSRAGSGIVMEPDTGRILALANRPAADPNRYGESTSSSRRNRAVVDLYEPGSTFKVVSAAAVLDRRAVSPSKRFYCGDGGTRVAGHWIRDHRPFGVLSFREILEQSSNVGMLKVCRAISSDTLYGYIRAFGFGEKTGIELPGERAGLLRPVHRWSALSPASISFGQEIGVTVVQMASAFATLANEGVRVPPRVVLGMRDADGRFHPARPPRARKVLAADTARQLSELLEGVVVRGTGVKGAVPGYDVAAKTGTAQKALPRGRGYSPTDYVASIGGFGPVGDPRLVVLVVLDAPAGERHQGGSVAAPVFGRIMADALAHLGVEPDRPTLRSRPGRSLSKPVVARSRPLPRRIRTAPGRVPDVRGSELREAIATLARHGCGARVEGTGVVASQDPAPGAPLAEDGTCSIRLSESAPPASRRRPRVEPVSGRGSAP